MSPAARVSRKASTSASVRSGPAAPIIRRSPTRSANSVTLLILTTRRADLAGGGEMSCNFWNNCHHADIGLGASRRAASAQVRVIADFPPAPGVWHAYCLPHGRMRVGLILGVAVVLPLLPFELQL